MLRSGPDVAVTWDDAEESLSLDRDRSRCGARGLGGEVASIGENAPGRRPAADEAIVKNNIGVLLLAGALLVTQSHP